MGKDKSKGSERSSRKMSKSSDGKASKKEDKSTDAKSKSKTGGKASTKNDGGVSPSAAANGNNRPRGGDATTASMGISTHVVAAPVQAPPTASEVITSRLGHFQKTFLPYMVFTFIYLLLAILQVATGSTSGPGNVYNFLKLAFGAAPVLVLGIGVYGARQQNPDAICGFLFGSVVCLLLGAYIAASIVYYTGFKGVDVWQGSTMLVALVLMAVFAFLSFGFGAHARFGIVRLRSRNRRDPFDVEAGEGMHEAPRLDESSDDVLTTLGNTTLDSDGNKGDNTASSDSSSSRSS